MLPSKSGINICNEIGNNLKNVRYDISVRLFMSYFELQRLKVLQLVPVLSKTVINLGKSDKNSILFHTQSIYCYGEKRGIF